MNNNNALLLPYPTDDWVLLKILSLQFGFQQRIISPISGPKYSIRD